MIATTQRHSDATKRGISLASGCIVVGVLLLVGCKKKVETGEYGGTYTVLVDGRPASGASEVDTKAVFEGQGDAVALKLLDCTFAGKQEGGGRISLSPVSCKLPATAAPIKLGGEATVSEELLTITLTGPGEAGAVVDLEFTGMKSAK